MFLYPIVVTLNVKEYAYSAKAEEGDWHCKIPSILKRICKQFICGSI